LADVHEPEHGFDERRFSGSVGSDDPDQLTVVEVEVDAAQDVDPGQVSGVDVLGVEQKVVAGQDAASP